MGDMPDTVWHEKTLSMCLLARFDTVWHCFFFNAKQKLWTTVGRKFPFPQRACWQTRLTCCYPMAWKHQVNHEVTFSLLYIVYLIHHCCDVAEAICIHLLLSWFILPAQPTSKLFYRSIRSIWPKSLRVPNQNPRGRNLVDSSPDLSGHGDPRRGPRRASSTGGPPEGGSQTIYPVTKPTERHIHIYK